MWKRVPRPRCLSNVEVSAAPSQFRWEWFANVLNGASMLRPLHREPGRVEMPPSADMVEELDSRPPQCARLTRRAALSRPIENERKIRESRFVPVLAPQEF